MCAALSDGPLIPYICSVQSRCHQRLHLRHIALQPSAPYFTVDWTLNCLWLGLLCIPDPKAPVQCDERQSPGDLNHIDVKTPSSLSAAGSPHYRNPAKRVLDDVGHDRTHAAIDDTTRLAYIEVSLDEQ